MARCETPFALYALRALANSGSFVVVADDYELDQQWEFRAITVHTVFESA